MSPDEIQTLLAESRWSDVIAGTDQLTSDDFNRPFFWLARGSAFREMKELPKALEATRHGLDLDAGSEWGNMLHFNVLVDMELPEQAIKGAHDYLLNFKPRETTKAWFVQEFVQLGYLEEAGRINTTRDVICNVKKSPRWALALQCFTKADTLEKVFESLFALKGAEEFSLIIIQDSGLGSDRYEQKLLKTDEVLATIAAHLPKLSKTFFSVELLLNERNLGTAPTCRRLLDYVCSRFDGFLFIEDDCLLAPGALTWARQMFARIDPLGWWFFSCESPFFDRGGRPPQPDLEHRLMAIADNPKLSNAFTTLQFVPSTCFGTTSDIWKLCANVRSFTRGPESLSRYMKDLGRKTIAPVVPLASDIGMLHALGYSFVGGGIENIREIKATYLMRKGEPDEHLIASYAGNADLLYLASSHLDEQAIGKVEELLKSEEAPE